MQEVGLGLLDILDFRSWIRTTRNCRLPCLHKLVSPTHYLTKGFSFLWNNNITDILSRLVMSCSPGNSGASQDERNFEFRIVLRP